MAEVITSHTIWEMGILFLLAANAAALLMQAVVHRIVPITIRRVDSDLSAAVFAVIGVTYAVLLSFVAMSAWERFSMAEASTRAEANLVASLRSVAIGYPDRWRAQIDANIVAYLREIIEVDWPAQAAGKTSPAISPALRQLETDLLVGTQENSSSASSRDFLLRVFAEISTDRRTRRSYDEETVPTLVWVVLLVGGALTVGSSHLLGGRRPSFHMIMTAALVSSGTLVLVLVLGLSSPYRGAFALSPKPYRIVLSEISQ